MDKRDPDYVEKSYLIEFDNAAGDVKEAIYKSLDMFCESMKDRFNEEILGNFRDIASDCTGGIESKIENERETCEEYHESGAYAYDIYH
jgi:hypothetical protein